MKFYIKSLMFFALLALIAYIGNQNLINALWLLFGVFIGFSIFYGMIRNGFIEIKSAERR